MSLTQILPKIGRFETVSFIMCPIESCKFIYKKRIFHEKNQKYSPESLYSFYFKGLYLRLIRTLDFLTSRPEWDGKRILVIGESQEGGQALAAAGLDSRVTAVVATVPAMCDWGVAIVGRAEGWPDPYHSGAGKEKMTQTLPYFDVAHILKDSNAILVVEIGFIDYTCPSSSIYAAINQTKGKKIKTL